MDLLKPIIFDNTDNIERQCHDGKSIFNAADISRVLDLEHVEDLILNFDSGEKGGEYKYGWRRSNTVYS